MDKLKQKEGNSETGYEKIKKDENIKKEKSNRIKSIIQQNCGDIRNGLTASIVIVFRRRKEKQCM